MAWTLRKTTLRAGQYQGLLSHEGTETPALPSLEALHDGAVLEGLSISPIEGAENQHMVTLQLPNTLMADALQTVIITDAATGAVMDTLAVLAGLAPEDDFRAEMDVMRAEIEMLKKAFRRHISST